MRARPTIRRSSALRRQLRKNQLACLLLAQGLPLILAGDEVGNSQVGNNNAYCQDNEIGWVDWEGLGREGDDLIDFIGHMTGIRRRRFPQIRSHRWLDGRRADGTYGVLWLTPAAEDMKEADWKFPEGTVPRLRAGPERTGRRAAVRRAQCRARGDRIHAAEAAGIQDLAATAEHRGRQASRSRISRRQARPRRLRARSLPLRVRHE